MSATQVAQASGPGVLLRVYAKCIAGRQQLNQQRIEDILGPDPGGR